MNIETNLCDTCIYEIPDCMNEDHVDVKFGDGIGKDNIIECNKHEEEYE